MFALLWLAVIIAAMVHCAYQLGQLSAVSWDRTSVTYNVGQPEEEQDASREKNR